MKWLLGASTLTLIFIASLAIFSTMKNIEFMSLLGNEPAFSTPIFKEVTNIANVGFRHHKLTKEMMPIGAGVVVFDYDNDGNHDLFVSDSLGPNALYSNNGDGTFTERARIAGISEPKIRSNGGCAADYDNDGDQDLYLTNYGPSRLFNNNGDGTFEDVTNAAGVSNTKQTVRSTGCAWGDYDQDGHLDFIVARHLNTQGSSKFITRDFRLAIGGLIMFHRQ